tara:strand:- start:450 stop:785 length:336 start_codon:yes stop_codon:yes gene_type:complete
MSTILPIIGQIAGSLFTNILGGGGKPSASGQPAGLLAKPKPFEKIKFSEPPGKFRAPESRSVGKSAPGRIVGAQPALKSVNPVDKELAFWKNLFERANQSRPISRTSFWVR